MNKNSLKIFILFLIVSITFFIAPHSFKAGSYYLTGRSLGNPCYYNGVCPFGYTYWSGYYSIPKAVSGQPQYEVYCADPDDSAGEGTFYSTSGSSIDVSNCANNGNYGCMLGSAFVYAYSKGWIDDYPTMTLAVRLIGSKRGFSHDKYVYQNTISYIDSGYFGQASAPWDNQLLYARSHIAGSLEMLQHTITLYKISEQTRWGYGNWKPWIGTDNVSGIEYDSATNKGKFTFQITSPFSDDFTKSLAVESLVPGISLNVTSKSKCGDYYCIYVTGYIDDYSRENQDSCNYKLKYKVKFTDIRQGTAFFEIVSNGAWGIQRYVVLDKSRIHIPSGEIEGEGDLGCVEANCAPGKDSCCGEDGKYLPEDECCNDLNDPCCVDFKPLPEDECCVDTTDPCCDENHKPIPEDVCCTEEDPCCGEDNRLIPGCECDESDPCCVDGKLIPEDEYCIDTTDECCGDDHRKIPDCPPKECDPATDDCCTEDGKIIPDCVNEDLVCQDQPNQMPTDCNEGTKGLIQDQAIGCILADSELNKNYDYTDNYVHSTGYNKNLYCKVTCRETVTFNMFGSTVPTYTFNGSFSDSTRFAKYELGISPSKDSTMAEISGTRECVSEIDYEKWQKKYEELNEAVRTTWNNFKHWENLHVLTTPTSKEIKCSRPASSCSACCNCHSCNCKTTTGKDGKTTTSCSRCCYPGSASACQVSTTRYTWPSKPYAVTNKNGTISIANSSATHGSVSCGGSTCSGNYCNANPPGSPSAWAGRYTSAKNAYEKALKAREEHIGYIQDCNMDKELKLNSDYSKYTRSSDSGTLYHEITDGYDFNPTLTYEYDDKYSSLIKIGTESVITDEDDVAYGSEFDKEKEMFLATKHTKTEKDKPGSRKEEKQDYWVCSGQGTGAKCTIEEVTVPTNTITYLALRKTAYFWQDAEFYSSISNGDISVNPAPNYMKLTTKNIFPLSINKSTGKYAAKAHIDNIGDKDRKAEVKFSGGDYVCDLDVCSKFTSYEGECADPVIPPSTCTQPEGCEPPTPVIHVGETKSPYGFYYRTIDVDNVFPTGVKTGTWNTVQARALISDIQNKGESIFLKEPTYEFIITPSNIRGIKEYNRTLDSTGQGYNDFNLNCNCSVGMCKCDSEFLRGLGNGGSLTNLVTSYKRDGVLQ